MKIMIIRILYNLCPEVVRIAPFTADDIYSLCTLLQVDHHRIHCTNFVLALFPGCFAVSIKPPIIISLKLLMVTPAWISTSESKHVIKRCTLSAFLERLNPQHTEIFDRPRIFVFITSNVLVVWVVKPCKPFLLCKVFHCSLLYWDALNSRNDKCTDDARSHFLSAVSNSLNYYSNNFYKVTIIYYLF